VTGMFDHLLAVLPQFLPSSGPLAPTLVALASIQVLVDSAWTTGVVLAAGRASRLWRRVAVRQRLERALGLILVALGLELAVDQR
jgi:threonine/homoserine/homoserine lactone efflux protein